MTDVAISLAFLLGCVAVVGINLTASSHDERHDAIFVSLLLLVAWAWSKLLWAMHVDFTRLYWLTDSIQAAAVGALWAAQPAAWKFALLLVFLDKAVLHVLFRAHWLGSRHDYIAALNGLFALELLCAAWPGGRHVGSHLGDWLAADHRRDRAAVPGLERPQSDQASAP